MTVRDKHSEQAEGGCHANAAVRLRGSTNFHAWRLRIVGDDFAMRESEKALDKGVDPAGRDIHAIIRNCLKLWKGRRSFVPIQLHVHATGPLDDGIATYGIVERVDEYVGAGDARSLRRCIQIGDKVTGTLAAERIGDWRFEAEHR
ncbi:MAG: hypothetical protein WA324_23760 [Bryobacteraceae bacterium]